MSRLAARYSGIRIRVALAEAGRRQWTGPDERIACSALRKLDAQALRERCEKERRYT